MNINHPSPDILPGQDIYGRDEEAPEPQSLVCKWCNGKGYEVIDGSLRCSCPDCGGTGRVTEDTEDET